MAALRLRGGLDWMRARQIDQSASSPAAGCNQPDADAYPPRSQQPEAVVARGRVEQSANHIAQHAPRGSRSWLAREA